MEETAEITREILRKVRRVEIKTNRLVNEAMAGAYQSAFKGQGMDFDEVREYMPGDDVRSIDWNVTAKMDQPYIKKFEEERELTIMLLVDLSASGDFGSIHESKRELAAELASVLAFSATKNNDKIGLILFTGKTEKFIPPKKGRYHVLRLIREILFYRPEGRETNIEGALEHLNRVLKRKAVVFVLSDFLQDRKGNLPKLNLEANFSEENSLLHTLELTNRRHDLICVTITDPREMELPKAGILTLEDAESGEQIEVDTHNTNIRRRYAFENKNRSETWRLILQKKGIDGFKVSTDRPYIDALRKFLLMRLNRR